MQIKITSLKQDLHTFDVENDDKITSLKEKLASILLIDAVNINIIYLGKILIDDSTIADNKIANESKLVYMIKKKPIVKVDKNEEPVVFSENITPTEIPKPEVNLFDIAEKHDEYKARLMPQIYEAFIRILNSNKDVIISDLNEERDKYTQIEQTVFDNIVNDGNFINEIVKFGGASSFITQNQPPMLNSLFRGRNFNQLDNMIMNIITKNNVEMGVIDEEGNVYQEQPIIDNTFTPQDLEDIAELEALCGDRDKAIRFYLMSGKNKNIAAGILFEEGFDDL